MRLKLVMIASLLAAAAGFGASILIVIVTHGSFGDVLTPARWHRGWWLGFVLYAPSFLAALLASMFVYRHTARRRKLQASLTLILGPLMYCGAQIIWLLLRWQ